MANNNSTTTGGVGLCGLLLVAFIVLKLTKVISWSWWAVLAPLWIPLLIAVIAAGFYLLIIFVESRR